MHVILTALGSTGDIFPLLGFGKALRERGHEVSFIAPAPFAGDAAAAGLELIELCDTKSYEEITATLQALPRLRRHASSSEIDILELFAEITPARLYQRIADAHRPGESVLANTEVFTFGAGTLAAETLGLPYASVWHNLAFFHFAQPVLPRGLSGFEDTLRNGIASLVWWFQPFKQRFSQLRERLGLPRLPNFYRAWLARQQLNLGLFPDWAAPWFKGRLANCVLSDFPLYERGQDDPLPADVQAFLDAGPPPVVFSNASWNANLEEFFKASLAASRKLGLRAVLVSSRVSSDVQALAGEDAILARYVSFKALLPRCAAVVHHGGLGTVARALASGTPQVIVPMTLDQPHNASEVVKLGAGRSVPPKNYARDIAAALSAVLGTPRIQAACKELASRFPQKPNLEPAVVALERLYESSKQGSSAQSLKAGT